MSFPARAVVTFEFLASRSLNFRFFSLCCLAIVVITGAVPVAQAHYSLDRFSTTNGGGTWGSILRLEASVSGSTITFNVSKQSGSFNTSGTMYLKVGTYEPWGVNRDSRTIAAGSYVTSFSHDLDDFTGYPKEFYGRYESSNGGHAWVGPIEVSFSNGVPGSPTISSVPSSATVDVSVSVRVYRGHDPDGDQVKVQCTATGSNRTDASPYVSGFADGGNSSLPSFLFYSTGTQTIYCATFDRHGAGSSTAQRTITVAEPNSPPGPPTISASPSVATLGERAFVTVWRGSDPNGEQVKVECAAGGSDRTDDNPFDSGFGNGGSSTSASFLFSQLGSRAIYCTSFDPGGTASPTVSRSIEVVEPQPSIGNISVTPGTLGTGDQQVVSWQSQNQSWFLMQLFDAAGVQPVDTSAFLSSSCQQLGAGAGAEGCLLQANPSVAESASWVVPSELATGDYTIKVAVWYSDGNAAGAFSPPFTVEQPDTGGDFVNVSPWAQEAASYLVDANVVDDPPDHDLRGTSDANRAEAATLIYRSLGGGRFEADDNFADWYGGSAPFFFGDVVDPGVWYHKPATYLADLAYDDPVTVFNQGPCIFRPAKTISRGWVVKAVMEAWDQAPMTSLAGVSPFDDVSSGHPAAGYIYRARQLGVVDGTDNLFRPDEPADRQDLFVMLHRLLDGSANSVAPVPWPSPQAGDFSRSRDCSGIGRRFEQALLIGPQPPRVEISATGPCLETVGDLAGVYVVYLEAVVHDLDGGTYLGADGTSYTANPFCAWSADSGVFVDVTPEGEPPYCQVKWIAPTDRSSADGTAAESQVTLFLGDGLGHEVSDKATLALAAPSADPTVPTASMDPLPSSVNGNRVVDVSGDVSDQGDPGSAGFGVLAVRMTASLDGGDTWHFLGDADLLVGGRWSFRWPTPGRPGTVILRAGAVNLRGNQASAERSTTVRTPLSIGGQVVDGFGEAVENALVELSGSGSTARLRSDNSGAFRFTEQRHGLQPGTDYRLTATVGRSEVVLEGLSVDAQWPSLSETLVVDIRAPFTRPSIAEGQYDLPVEVALECVDYRSGCAATYFTVDGSAPTEDAALYGTPLLLEQDTVLRYFSADHAGNVETVQTQVYDIGSNAGSASGLILEPVGEQAGNVTVSADAADPDGLEGVRVVFVGGGTLVLCEAATTPCAGGGPFTQSGIDPSAYGVTESGPVDLELWVEDALGHQEMVDVHSFLWQADGTLPTFTLTLVKEGDGDGTVSGTGIDCPLGCATATATLGEGTAVTLIGSGEQFIGFTGETCYGIGSCSFTMTRDRTIHAGFALPDSFRVLYTSPANGDTGVGVSSIPRIVFNREVFAGPQLGAIVLRYGDGTSVAITPVLHSDDMYLSLVTENPLEREKGYVVEMPSSAVLDGQGSPLAAPYGFSFVTEQEGTPEMHVAAYPREVIEGRESKVSIWFKEAAEHDRSLTLSSGPSGELIHPSEVELPAGEVLLELDVDSRVNSGSLADFVETLQVRETELGTQGSVQITVVNETPSNGSHLRWLGSVLSDDDGDGVFEADESAELTFEVVNQGGSGIANVSLEFEVATGTSGLDILGGAPYRCDIGYLDPGEARSCTESLRADADLPTGTYHVHVFGFSSQDAMRALAGIEVVNNFQPDFVLSTGNITSNELEPGTTIDLQVHASNQGDGFSEELPLVEVWMDVDGEERLLYETYLNVRGYSWSQQSLEFPITAPDVPGEHPIRARINPAGRPDRPQIPESDTTNNQASELILRVAAPNLPPLFDPLPDTVRVDMGEPLSFAASASDPNGDALAYSLALGAPAGMVIDPVSGVLIWTPLCSQGPGSYGIEILVADLDGAMDSHPLTVVVGARADLRVVKTATSSSALPGGPVGFTVAVTNLGPSCATDVTVRDTFASSLADVAWTCAASAGSSCSANGGGDLLDDGVSLLRDGAATYEIAARVVDDASGLVINEASATVSGGAVDPVPVNDVDTAAVTLQDLDFGDAGDVTVDPAWSYPVTLADDGARHGLGSGLHLGALIDGEADGQPSPAADGDDLDTTDDEDGVVFTTPLVPCQAAEVEVTASAPALLSAWIDFGRDGGWGEAADAVLADEPLAAGVSSLTIPVPCAAVSGDTFARFRLSSAGGLGVGGVAADGEVEDHGVVIEQVLNTLTVTTSGTGSGVVTSTPTGIDCGADCSEDFPAGTLVTLTATPASGSVFAGWSGEGCSTGSCQVTMDASRAVAASFDFVEPCHLLTLAKQGQGADPVAEPAASADCPSGRYHAGESIQLSAQPAAGWVVDGWVGTADDTSTSQVNQLTMPESDHAASVVYAESSTPAVLLVDDDDDDPDVRAYYTEVLDALGVSYDVWPTGASDDEPDAATLGLYSKVVWFTGASFRDSVGPGASAEVALASYLDAGGCLLLSSQDYLLDRGETPFMSAYLGLESSVNDSKHDVIAGQGEVFGGLGPYVLSFPVNQVLENYSDLVAPDATAEVAFLGDGGEAAIDKLDPSFRTVFLAFPFEALGAEARYQVLRTALNACELDCAGPFHLTLENHLVTGVELVTSCDRLYVGEGTQVLSGGELTLRAPGGVIFSDGFVVNEGGKLRVEVEKP